MSDITYFSASDLQDIDFPRGFPSPFSNQPHAIAQQAAFELQQRLMSWRGCTHNFAARGGGKMFGVLVVRGTDGQLGYLSAFSGMLGGVWQVSGFVPPLFDPQAVEQFLPAGEAALKSYDAQITTLQNSAEFKQLKVELNHLQQKRAIELAALSVEHQQRKRARHQKREQLTASADDEVTLIKLSFESQRDRRDKQLLQTTWREKLAVVESQMASIQQQINEIKHLRTKHSNQLQRRLFGCYELINRVGERRLITDFFGESLPPGGSGDCAAPKLLQYAHQLKLLPVALAEFWWGASPPDGVRHHGQFYPACRGKCHPVLPFMLEGITVRPRQIAGRDFKDSTAPETVYEDDTLLVVNKPSGLLSVPGKEVVDSVQVRLQQRYPDNPELLLVHRLDMSTSGLLLVAKNRTAHKALQRQFLQRTIDKCYVAVLSKRLPDLVDGGAQQGVVELPLRVDFDDRPRQIVCFAHGKPATTHWEVISRDETTTRVHFYPHTGRTHQLRVHAAHHTGLDAPILGDELYGSSGAERLLLHAEKLCFCHPVTEQRIEVVSPTPF